MFLELALVISFCLSLLFAAWVATLVMAYLLARPTHAGAVGDFQWHFLVPARDEEAVIGSTLAYMCKTFPEAHVWVIDDASEDETAAIVEAAAAGNRTVHLVRRRLPDARTGKSDALNTAYRVLSDWLDPSVDHARVVVVVNDADGLPAAQLLDEAAGPELLGDARVAGVQVEVRMINRDAQPPPSRGDPAAAWWHRSFVRVQDLEFRTTFMAMQLQRRWTHSVNLGGNGQLTRLSALDDVAGAARAPWRGSLLEDFELGLHLLLAGWRNGATRQTWVEQEGLWSARRYAVQRTRWAQGSMECMRYLPNVLRSARLTFLGKAEIAYFLVRPWLQLVGSVVYPVAAVLTFAWAAGVWNANGRAALPALTLFLVGAVVGIAAFAVWAFLYKRRCEPGVTRRTVLTLAGLTLLLGAVTPYAITWYALVRHVRGKHAWAKTRRNVEENLGPIAKET